MTEVGVVTAVRTMEQNWGLLEVRSEVRAWIVSREQSSQGAGRVARDSNL